MPHIVFIVMIETAEGARGVHGVYAAEIDAARDCYAMSHLHFKTWYEPKELQPAKQKDAA